MGTPARRSASRHRGDRRPRNSPTRADPDRGGEPSGDGAGHAPDSPLLELQRHAGNRATQAVLAAPQAQRQAGAQASHRGGGQSVEDIARRTLQGVLAAPILSQFVGILSSGRVARSLVVLAASAGFTDEVELTNLLFWGRHPELAGERIRPDQRDLARDWLSIRDVVVRPALRQKERQRSEPGGRPSPEGGSETAGSAAASGSGQPAAAERATGLGDLVGQAVDRARALGDRAAELVGSDPSSAADLVTRELTEIYSEYTNLPIVIRPPGGEPRTVHVHTPYFINRESGYRRAAMDARSAGPRIRRFFVQISRETSWHSRHGKGTAQEIAQILQSAVDEGLLGELTGRRPTADELRTWLREHGIGVDCSGFVRLALMRVMEAQGGPAGDAAADPGHGTGQLRPTDRDVDRVSSPGDLAPGDTMNIPGHVRIIARVRHLDEGGVEFTTYESRAGGRQRVGMTEQRWRYPARDAFGGLLRHTSAGGWRRAGEPSGGYGRYRGLASS